MPRSLNCHLEKLIKSILHPKDGIRWEGGSVWSKANPPRKRAPSQNQRCEQCDALGIRRVPAAGNIGKHWSNRNGMEVANAGFSISPPLYYPLARSWEGRARLYYTPLSINARLSANFSWLSYFDCLCATRAVSEPVLTRGPDFSLPFFFFLLLWTRMCSRDTDDITKLARESCIRSQTDEVSIVFFEW